MDLFVELLLLWQQTTEPDRPRRFPTSGRGTSPISLQLLDCRAGRQKSGSTSGSGGGFPGIPIACALADKPGAMVHLVESNGKKAAFLREAVRVTGVPAKVHQMRAEDYGDSFAEGVDAVTARALYPR